MITSTYAFSAWPKDALYWTLAQTFFLYGQFEENFAVDIRVITHLTECNQIAPLSSEVCVCRVCFLMNSLHHRHTDSFPIIKQRQWTFCSGFYSSAVCIAASFPDKHLHHDSVFCQARVCVCEILMFSLYG